jgi:hypothetical protein
MVSLGKRMAAALRHGEGAADDGKEIYLDAHGFAELDDIAMHLRAPLYQCLSVALFNFDASKHVREHRFEVVIHGPPAAKGTLWNLSHKEVPSGRTNTIHVRARRKHSIAIMG